MQEKENVSANTVSTIDPEEPIRPDCDAAQPRSRHPLALVGDRVSYSQVPSCIALGGWKRWAIAQTAIASKFLPENPVAHRPYQVSALGSRGCLRRVSEVVRHTYLDCTKKLLFRR
jgi:hypothetical protein